MSYTGVIIEESLTDRSVLDKVRILKTEIEPITPRHKTPWVARWTLHTIEIPDEKAQEIAELLSKAIDASHKSSWYADYKNDTYHFVIFLNKIFKVDRSNPVLYKDAKAYGMSLGIPEYQVNFALL